MSLAQAFAGTDFARFICSPAGRMARIAAGLTVLACGYTMRTTITGLVLVAVSLVPLMAGAFDGCVISALLGGPIRGAVLRKLGEQFPGIDECIRRMKSDDPALVEDGFWWLEPTGAAHLDRYVEELGQSSGIFRSYLIELVGNSTSPRAISILVALMNSEVRQDSEDAQLALWHMGNDAGKGLVIEHHHRSGRFTDYLSEHVSEYTKEKKG